MKKLGWGFIALLVVTMVAGLYLRQQGKNNMTEKTVFLFDTMCSVRAYGENSEAAVEKVVERLAEIHKKTDFFSDSSDVSRINSADAEIEVEVSQDVAKILMAAEEVRALSDGAFDVSIAPIVSLWNFSGEGRIPSDEELKDSVELVKNGGILIEGNKIKKTKAGTKIDLGGAAKGYAGDVAIELLKNFEVSGAIVDLGGNITAMGENPETDDGKWRIGIQKPFAPTGEYDEIIEIESGAVVTSGTYQRYFEKDGARYHHIIDPQTGEPARRDYSSVTVISDSALYGDCLATACFVLGENEGTRLAENLDAEVVFQE